MRGYTEPTWAWGGDWRKGEDECPCAEARSRDCHLHPTDPDDD